MLVLLQSILQRECPFAPEQLTLVGVSGGADSLCLLDALHRLGYRLVVAHLNHGLRPEASEEAHRVQKMAQARGLRFVADVVDTPAYAQEQGLSVEEAARELRYRFLFAQAGQVGAQAVAVAHTADDQVETVLMHLLRGAGLEGLRGMPFWSLPNPWSTEIALARPLLAAWREQVLAYCQEHGLEPVHDPSNLDTTYFRNRLRHELIPSLEQVNPHLRQNVFTMARLLAGDFAVLQQQVAQAWQACWLESGPGWLALDLAALRGLDVALQRRVLRQAIAYHRPGLRDIEAQVIERGVDFLAAPSRTGVCNLAAEVYLQVEGGRLWVADWRADLPAGPWPALPAGQGLWLDVPGVLTLGGGWKLRAEICEELAVAQAEAAQSRDRCQAWLDAEGLSARLLVRSRQPGERFAPAGMAGHTVKLSDAMINAKIPRRARAAWPLVCAAGQVIWLPGYRPAEGVALRPGSKQGIHLQLLCD